MIQEKRMFYRMEIISEFSVFSVAKRCFAFRWHFIPLINSQNY